MKTSKHVRALSDALVQAAEVEDGHSRQTAQRLVGAIGPALQLETLSMAVNLADEVNRLTDAAAGAAGRSLNAWIIGAMRSALAAHQTNQSHSGGRSFAGRTSNGVGGSLRGWVS